MPCRKMQGFADPSIELVFRQHRTIIFVRCHLKEGVCRLLHAIASKKELTAHAYYVPVADILENSQFQLLKQYRHHIRTTRFQHSINVSYYSYLICCRFRWDAVSAARAGLLHDFYFYETVDYDRSAVQASHFSTHPTLALSNAKQAFLLNEKETDSIVHHMWPFVPQKPHCKEGIVIAVVDKCVAVLEFLTFRRKLRFS